MTRRHLLLASGVGAASAASGWGLWHLINRPTAQAVSPEQALWAMRFEQPDGGTIQMHRALGGPVLLNFWATWCPPCLKEMPLLERFYQQQRKNGWRVMGLAVDSPAPVQEFLVRQPVSFPIGLAGMNGVELSRTLGNPQGGLPFTVIFNRHGTLVDRKTGALTEADMAAWAQAGGPKPSTKTP